MASIKQYTAEEIEQILKAYIAHQFAYDQPNFMLTNDFELIKQRLIDSMGIFQLVRFIEKEFGIIWEPEELVLKHFETIDSLKAFVLSKMGATQP